MLLSRLMRRSSCCCDGSGRGGGGGGCSTSDGRNGRTVSPNFPLICRIAIIAACLSSHLTTASALALRISTGPTLTPAMFSNIERIQLASLPEGSPPTNRLPLVTGSSRGGGCGFGCCDCCDCEEDEGGGWDDRLLSSKPPPEALRHGCSAGLLPLCWLPSRDTAAPAAPLPVGCGCDCDDDAAAWAAPLSSAGPVPSRPDTFRNMCLISLETPSSSQLRSIAGSVIPLPPPPPPPPPLPPPPCINVQSDSRIKA